VAVPADNDYENLNEEYVLIQNCLDSSADHSDW
jgi:hypothetical protein